MSIVRNLNQLQETELAIDANEQAQAKIGMQLKDNHVVELVKGKLAAEQKRLDELTGKQKDLDYQIEDLSAKIKTINRKLYDGKTTNSKELSNLQTEGGDFQKNRSKLEDKVLELMEVIETVRQRIAAASQELAVVEAEWAAQHKILLDELEQLHTNHAALIIKRDAFVSQVDPAALEIYKGVKLRKGTAVAKVEQGICRGCRIAVSNAELQQVKMGHVIKCNSCGRILYLP